MLLVVATVTAWVRASEGIGIPCLLTAPSMASWASDWLLSSSKPGSSGGTAKARPSSHEHECGASWLSPAEMRCAGQPAAWAVLTGQVDEEAVHLLGLGARGQGAAIRVQVGPLNVHCRPGEQRQHNRVVPADGQEQAGGGGMPCRTAPNSTHPGWSLPPGSGTTLSNTVGLVLARSGVPSQQVLETLATARLQAPCPLTVGHENAHACGTEALGHVEGHSRSTAPAAVCTIGRVKRHDGWGSLPCARHSTAGGAQAQGLRMPGTALRFRGCPGPKQHAQQPGLPTDVGCDSQLGAGCIVAVLDIDAHRQCNRGLHAVSQFLQ